jgi:polyisoprenyl-phosphate glycosyltransferase
MNFPQALAESTDSPAQEARPLLSVVIPCFNEQESIPDLLNDLGPRLDAQTNGSWEVILVDDGSIDATRQVMQLAHEQDERVRGLILSRNFGHQAAIFAGLAYASGRFIGVMDADLQDPPAVLVECLDKARGEDLDLVYAVRRRREGGGLFKIGYWIFYRVMHRLAEYSWPVDAGDFSVFSRRVALLVMGLPEHVRVLRGLRFWVGLKQGSVAYDRPERGKGESKYNFFKLSALAMNSLTSFSNVPLRLASLVGISMSVFSIVIGVLLLLNRFFPSFTLFGYYIGANPGTTTVVILLLLIGSLLFLCIGILGEYLGIVMKEVKRRPVAVVQQQLGLESPSMSSPLILETHGFRSPAR